MFTEIVLGLASEIMPIALIQRFALAQRIVVSTQSIEGLEYVREHGMSILDRLSLRGYTPAVEDEDGVVFLWDEEPKTIGINARRNYWVCSFAGSGRRRHEGEYMHVTGTVRVIEISPHDATPFNGEISVSQWHHTTTDRVIDSGPDPEFYEFSDCPFRMAVRALLLLSLPHYQRFLT